MNEQLVALLCEKTKLDSLYKLYQNQELTHGERQLLFATILAKFHAMCIGLHELLPHDPLHANNIRYRQEEGRQIPDYSEQQLRQHFRTMMKKIHSALQELLYNMLCTLQASITDLAANRDLTPAESSQLTAISARFNWIATTFVNKRKLALHNELLEHLASNPEPLYRSFLLRHTIQAQHEIIARWSHLLTNENRVINLANLDITSANFSELDISQVVFNEFNIITDINLTNTTFRPEQFVVTSNIATIQGINPEVLQQIRVLKSAFIDNQMTKISQEIIEYRASLALIEQMQLLVCQGALPDLSRLDDHTLKQIIHYALISFYINTLPDDDSACHARATEHPELIVAGTREAAIATFTRLLHQRNMKLSKEVIAFTQQQKMSILFERFSGVRDTLAALEKIINDSAAAERQYPAFQAYAAELQHFKAEKNRLQTHYDQQLIDAFLAALFDEPDQVLTNTPAKRIETLCDVARFRDDLVIDLSAKDLTGIQFTANTDFSNVRIILTSDQERQLSYRHQQQRYARFYQAIQQNNFNEVEICLAQGLNLNHCNEIGRTPIMSACFANKPAMVEFLIQHGANINIRTLGTSMTILEGAARSQYREVVTVLQQYGAELDLASAIYLNDVTHFEQVAIDDIRRGDPYTQEPFLHIAIRQKAYDLITWLLHQGAALTAARGTTPMEFACELGDQRAIDMLLAHGAVLDNRAFRTVCEHNYRVLAEHLREHIDAIDLYCAIYLNETATIRTLVNGQFNSITADGYTPMAIACRLGNLEVVEWLIQNRADLYMPAAGSTPLLHAVETNQVEVVRYLLTQNVSAHAVIAGLITPFMEAIRSGQTEIVEVMLCHYLQNKLPLNMVNEPYANRTPLLIAAYEGHTNLVRLLLAAGADWQIRDLVGNLPLHLAAGQGHLEIVKLLSHPLLQLQNGDGRTPRQLAQASGREAVVELLSCFDTQPEAPAEPLSPAASARQNLVGQLGLFAAAAPANPANGQPANNPNRLPNGLPNRLQS